MATSKLFSILGPSIIRNSNNFPSHQLNRIFLRPPQQSRRCSFSALTIDSNDDTHALATDESSAASAHPWPEWVDFLDRLKAKGYLSVKENEGAAAIYAEMNVVVKEACLSFARHRFDIFRLLPAQDIQAVVEKGCPNLLRKAVNSAKRLRAYVELDESDACSSCNLRGSCDRAYVMLNESDAAARTIDIVRILLIYALDPVTISGEEKPTGRELVEASVRKLLLKLVELGETAPDPDLPQPAAVTSTKKKRDLNLSNSESSNNDQMKPGDWVCTGCNFMNFAKNVKCLRCQAEGPKRSSAYEIAKKIGDWDCPQCSFMNFSSNRQCFRCSGPRPKRELRPGDWECSKCDFVNFNRNSICKKCNHEGPRGSTLESDSMAWNRPY